MKKEYNADPFLTSLPVPTSTKSSSLRGRQTALVIRFSNQDLKYNNLLYSPVYA